jgi:hypothetical protein
MAGIAKILEDLYNSDLRNDCTGFFKGLAKRLGLPGYDHLGGGAILEKIADPGSGWEKLGVGSTAGAMAAAKASEGYLVVALLKAADHDPHRKNKRTGQIEIRPYTHGHISIVIPGPLEEGYPLVVSGSLIPDGRSDGSKAVLGVWRRVDAPKVQYYVWPSKFPILLDR